MLLVAGKLRLNRIPHGPGKSDQAFLKTFADSPVMIIPAHFPTPSAGWIRSHDGSFRFHFDRPALNRHQERWLAAVTVARRPAILISLSALRLPGTS
jgi:hypothetical protein